MGWYNLELSFTLYGRSGVLMTASGVSFLGTLPLRLTAILFDGLDLMLCELPIRVNKGELRRLSLPEKAGLVALLLPMRHGRDSFWEPQVLVAR
jgi:hypothetical protein